NWVLLNSDGIVKLDLGIGAAGGVVCDRNGDWIFGYDRHLGQCSVFNAELWGILDGLMLLQKQGYKKVVIQSDNLQVVKAIQDNLLEDSNLVLIKRIQQVLQHESHWLLRHVPKEKNQVADCITKMSFDKRKNL
ncbi:hypothetical protein Gohar_011275, partial [Gossypium harknessii]|nr:hypothetical protein [Gossypium harknessii]